MQVLKTSGVGLLFSASLLTCTAVQANNDRSGRWFADLSAGTSFYTYDEKDIRSELPDTFIDVFSDGEFDDNDSDIVNANFGVGYYVTDDFAITARYTSGIEYGFLSGLFNDESYDIDVAILEIEATYSTFPVSDSIDAYVSAGLAYYNVDAEVRSTDQPQQLVTFDNNEVNVKAGVGLLWQFSDNWAVKTGYEHYNYLKLSKWHITWQYQF